MLWNDAANEHRTTSDVVRYMWEVKKLTDISLGFMTQSLLQQVWFRRFPKSLDNALEMNRYVMTQFQQACRQNRVRLTYVLVPTKLLIEPEDMAGVLERVKKYNSGYTLDRLQNFENGIADRVLRDCGELGIAAIDLRQPMREQHGKARLYYPDEMHLNPAGNRVIAHILNGAMAQQLNASDQRTTVRQ